MVELLKAARLDRVMDQPAATLSGGELQRLAIVQAMAGDPRVILLDEPGASLDPSEQSRLEQLIASARDRGVAVLLATHNLGQARRLCDHILFFEQGKLTDQLSSETFFGPNAPSSVKTFLQSNI